MLEAQISNAVLTQRNHPPKIVSPVLHRQNVSHASYRVLKILILLYQAAEEDPFQLMSGLKDFSKVILALLEDVIMFDLYSSLFRKVPKHSIFYRSRQNGHLLRPSH